MIAVFELYSDVTELVQKSRTDLYQGFAFILLGYLALFITVYLFVRHADNIIKLQYRELDSTFECDHWI